MLEEIKHEKLRLWIEEIISLCEPTKVILCDGSDDEARVLCDELVEKGTFIPLDEKKRPGSFLCRSNPKDVARVEEKTFICSKHEKDAGPTNHWKDPSEMKEQLKHLFKGCMHGRTLYIIPFSMGPLGSDIAKIGVELTDSAYVVVNMRIMTRMGKDVLDLLEEDKPFIPCVHSVGVPLKVGDKDTHWPCDPEKTVISHFPETRSIWSFGSGYGGNALLGKKCFALRIASVMAKEEMWMAEHMLIVGVTNPEGKTLYFAAAFPSACGKTNLAMLEPSLPGWKVECVGDDIAWMKIGKDGRLYAINPEYGFFGVAPGTSDQSNPNALASCSKNSVFTNVAMTQDHDVWWEGLTDTPPDGLIDWHGNPWTKDCDHPAAHPNSRFTAPAKQCPVIDPNWEDPKGVPIAGIIFGGRRSSTVPLVTEAFDWEHGTFMGVTVSSEMTAAAAGTIGKLRHDPFAMLPFCGYNMGDYFDHWLKMGKETSSEKLPKIFSVNWFKKDANGKFLWPGFGENIRVLKWMFERIEGEDNGVKSPIGILPKKETLDLSGLSINEATLETLTTIDRKEWVEEAKGIEDYLKLFKDHLPDGIVKQLRNLKERLDE